jgi:hypothetical protein
MQVLADLTHVIDRLTGVDLDEVDNATLHDMVVHLAQQRDRLAAVHAQAIARWAALKIWQDDGSRSAAARLARETTQFTATARRELRRARRLTSMPITTAAALNGELSLDQVDVLTKANAPHRRGAMGRDETTLVGLCRDLDAAQSLKVATYWGRHVDAAVGHETKQRDVANHLHASATLDGTVVVNGQLDPLGGAVFMNELQRLTDELRLADMRAGVDRTPAQRRSAALIEMATRSASMPPDARRPRPVFSVLLGDDSFRNLCELANGTVVSTAELRPWITTADLEVVLFDGPSTVLTVSHRRTFTGALRRAIEVRDRHCQHPAGCEVLADQCDVDHIVPYAQGGRTDQFNGRLQCPTHNRRADLHDHAAHAPAARGVDHLDVFRARLRWRIGQGVYADASGP